MDPELFFPPRGDNLGVWSAKSVCKECPVRAECLTAGRREKFGIWGGQALDERYGSKRKTRAAERRGGA